VGKIRNVRSLSPDIAIMNAVGGMIMARQSDIEPERNSVHTLVATKESDDKWRIAAFNICELSTLEDQRCHMH
jgi:uncharacterized protein (TIGR02246 family)